MDKQDSIEKLGTDYGLTPAGVRHAIETYQTIICEITGGKLSKLTYDADYILEQAKQVDYQMCADEQFIGIATMSDGTMQKAEGTLAEMANWADNLIRVVDKDAKIRIRRDDGNGTD